jgi:RND superfamily putative drug exporter
MTLVPALLTVLGERSWYMPGWLNRLLPNITIEPPAEHEEPVLQPQPVGAGTPS